METDEKIEKQFQFYVSILLSINEQIIFYGLMVQVFWLNYKQRIISYESIIIYVHYNAIVFRKRSELIIFFNTPKKIEISSNIIAFSNTPSCTSI